MTKKLIATLTALTLCAVVVIGTTLAYFSTETDTVKNTFTYSVGENPEAEIEEPNWPDDPDPLSPEKYYTKDPIVTFKNASLEQEYYVAMVISGSAGEDALSPDALKEILNYNGAGGIAKIHNWNTTAYDYQIDETTGTVYAYYKTKLNKNVLSSTAVFEGVKFNKDLSAFIDEDTEEGSFFNIDIKGYVVSSINDTNADNEDWGSSKAAMQAAFPDVFTTDLVDAANITTIYPNATI